MSIQPQPNPRLWTLRFKNHKTTVILYVDPSQSFTSIKAHLLHALSQRNLSELNDHAIPEDPEDVVFGVPVDRLDFAKGWVGLEIPSEVREEENSDEDAEGGESKVKKGRGKKKKMLNGGGKKSMLNASPAGAGLKDNSVLAFRFRGGEGENEAEEEWNVVVPAYEDEGGSQA